MKPNPSLRSTSKASPTFVVRDDLQLVDIATVHDKSARAKELLAKMNGEHKAEVISIIDYLSYASTQAVDDLKSYQIKHLHALSAGGPNSSQLEASPKPTAPPKNTKLRSATEMNQTEVNMLDDLPELPFEEILRYLTLEARLKCRAVSRSWRKRFDSYPVKSLCYFERHIGARQTVSNEFVQNFISSTRFAPFFKAFRHSILSNLKHLRLCYLRLDVKSGSKLFRTLNSFDQLEQLDLFDFNKNDVDDDYEGLKIKLNLPMLQRVQCNNVPVIRKLTLDSPRLQKIKLVNCSMFLRLVIVHTESIETIIINQLDQMRVKNLKNLKKLYIKHLTDPTLLSGLQLEELHLDESTDLSMVFEQKKRYGLDGMKIFYNGILMSSPDDWPLSTYSFGLDQDEKIIELLVANRARLADEIPFWDCLNYLPLERVDPNVQIDILNRLTDLNLISLSGSKVQNIERFLNKLKMFRNITRLEINSDAPQEQELFDQLPEHCEVQELSIYHPVSDFGFLFRLKSLCHLSLEYASGDLVRKAFEELPLLAFFEFNFLDQDLANHYWYSISRKLDHRFEVRIKPCFTYAICSDLGATIKLLRKHKC